MIVTFAILGALLSIDAPNMEGICIINRTKPSVCIHVCKELVCVIKCL